MFLQLLASVFAVYVLQKLLRFWISFRHQARLYEKMPGSPGLPILGHILELGRTTETMPRSALTMSFNTIKQGFNIMKLRILHQHVFVPLDGEALKYILDSNEEITKGDDYDVFVPWLGRGLLTSTGDKWRRRRKMLTPTFHFSMLEGYIYSMNRHARVLIDILEDHVGKEVDMFPYIKRCTLDIICDTAMGKQLDSQHCPDQPYVQAICRLMQIGMDYSMKPLLWTPLGRWLTGIEFEFRRCIKIAHDFTTTVILERMESIAKGEVEPHRKAFLDLMIQQKGEQNLTLEDIREETDTFMFEGHDTTTSGLGWTLWCLACNPEQQQKAYEEVAAVFESNVDGDCLKEELGKLPYLERCIKESMRMFPPVPFVIRLLQNDLKMGDYLLPKDSAITIAPYLVHHNPNIYPDSNTFNPDNFLPEKTAERHPYDYIPFSAGPRNCIGQKFALHEEKIILAWLLRRFRFESTRPMLDNVRLSEVVLKPKMGVPVILHKR